MSPCVVFTLASGVAVAGVAFSKATAAVDWLVDLAATCETLAADPAVSSDDTNWITIQRMLIKTASQKDLAIDSTFQGAILTETEVKSSGGTLDSPEAQAGIAARIPVTDVDGMIAVRGGPSVVCADE